MAESLDIRLQDNDLLISGGDLVVGASDMQHIEDTINAFPGWWKEHPKDGVGIFSYINSSGTQQELARKIKLELQADGYNVERPEIVITQDGITVNPNATKI